MAETTISINNLTHPTYQSASEDWYKWRLTFEGGDRFINEYLQRFSKGETTEEFKARKELAYCPAFAKAAVVEIQNSIYQRMPDITRVKGTRTYQEATKGRENGVDLLGSTMNGFMGTEVLPELLSMKKVGVYIDMPPKNGPTLAQNIGRRPYIYMYKVEDIRAWDYDESPTPNMFRAILLRDHIWLYDNLTGLPYECDERYRFYYLKNGEVYVKIFNSASQSVDISGNIQEDDSGILLEGLTRIPFVVLELQQSLLKDIANYQIALLNLGSADMAYAIGANFPFYTEQFDPRAGNITAERAVHSTIDANGLPVVATPAVKTVDIGSSTGRLYPKDLDRPGFISPSPAPMKASMEKQNQLKMDIRLLINLAISNMQVKMASAESKGMDERTLESGLSYIGLILEDGERRIAEIWSMYENSKDIATVNYPEKYDLRNDKDRRAEAEDLRKLLSDLPSITYQREIAKLIATIMLSNKISHEKLKKIHDEIDKSEIVNVVVKDIIELVEAGLLDPKLAADALNYPEGTIDKAQEAQAARLKLIQESQTAVNPAARGIKDAGGDAKIEKIGKPGRGTGE